MKKFFHYILMAALIGGVIPFTSCSDDDETINEWNLSYISLLPVDYLKPLTTEFNLTHSEGIGIEGKVDFQFIAVASKPVDQDIAVDIEVTTDLPVSTNNCFEFTKGRNKSWTKTVRTYNFEYY